MKKQNEKIKEYKELIESTLKSSSNYANTDSSNKKAFKKIAADKDSIATFTMAWRQYLKTHMNNARVNGNLDKSQMYFFENMIKLYQNFLPDEMSNISKENDLYTQYKKDEKAYRTQFNNFSVDSLILPMRFRKYLVAGLRFIIRWELFIVLL